MFPVFLFLNLLHRRCVVCSSFIRSFNPRRAVGDMRPCVREREVMERKIALLCIICVVCFFCFVGKTNDNLVRKQNKKRITFLRPCPICLFAERKNIKNMVGRAGALSTSLRTAPPPQGNHSGRPGPPVKKKTTACRLATPPPPQDFKALLLQSHTQPMIQYLLIIKQCIRSQTEST